MNLDQDLEGISGSQRQKQEETRLLEEEVDSNPNSEYKRNVKDIDLEESSLYKASDPNSSTINYSKQQAEGSSIVDWNPLKKPADLDMAMRHAKAKRIYKFEDRSKYHGKLCPCCGLPEEGGELIPLCADVSELYYLGSGYALYFSFFKYSIAILGVMVLVSGIYGIITNVMTGDCSSGEHELSEVQYCIQDYITIFTIANKRNNVELMEYQAILNILTVGALIILFQIMRYQLRKIVKEAEATRISPADYTVEFKGLPTSNHPLLNDDQLKGWIEERAKRSGSPVEVKKIVRSYDIGEYVYLTKRHTELLKKVEDQKGQARLKIEREIGQIESRIHDLRQEGFKHTGVVFVSFNTPEEASAVRKQFTRGRCQDWAFRLKRLCRSCFHSGPLPFEWDNIEAKIAPEPTELAWENLVYNIADKLKARTLIAVVLGIMIVICFLIVTAVTAAQETVREEKGDGSLEVQLLNLAASGSLAFLDVVLAIVVVVLTKKEIHNSKTNFSLVAAARVVVYKFINFTFAVMTAKIVMANDFEHLTSFDTMEKINFYGAGGVLQLTFLFLLGNAYANPPFMYFDPIYIMKWFKRRKAMKTNGAEITQEEAHEIFEGTEPDMEIRYGCLVSTILMTAFYAPAMPFVVVLIIIALIINYWTDKYLILRRTALPSYLGSRLKNEMMGYLELAPIAFAAGNLLFYLTLETTDDGGNKITAFDRARPEIRLLLLLTVVVSTAHFFLPVGFLNSRLFGVKIEVKKGAYDEVKRKFLTDYDIENPITRRKALDDLVMNALAEIEKEQGPMDEVRRRATLDKILSPLIALRVKELEVLRKSINDADVFDELERYADVSLGKKIQIITKKIVKDIKDLPAHLLNIPGRITRKIGRLFTGKEQKEAGNNETKEVKDEVMLFKSNQAVNDPGTEKLD